jgi:hypothetical protein
MRLRPKTSFRALRVVRMQLLLRHSVQTSVSSVQSVVEFASPKKVKINVDFIREDCDNARTSE